MKTKHKKNNLKTNLPLVAEDKSSYEYRNPLVTRYASPAMGRIFSERRRAEVWRELWIALADEERKCGLPISLQQVAALEKAKSKIDLARVRELELELKHDVMSHLKAFAEHAPIAEPIMHLGATSAFITDNADAVLIKEATQLILSKLREILKCLGEKIKETHDIEMTGYTHFQPAQPVTLGKRLALLAQDLLWDFEELEYQLQRFEPRGCKGTTGTQASFMVLFKQDYAKVRKLDEAVCKRIGFKKPVALSSQTASRKQDAWFMDSLAHLAASFSKMSYDLRLLQHLGEVTEDFSEKQIGSSAMAYKKNPMLAERITGLARYLMNISHNANATHAVQWLERSLDDSSNRRMTIPESFLLADALCESSYRLIKGLKVFPDVIKKKLAEKEDLFWTEAYMMEGTVSGASRQELHEEVRQAMLSGDVKKLIKKLPKSQKLSGAASQQALYFVNDNLKNFLARTKDLKKAEFKSAAI